MMVRAGLLSDDQLAAVQTLSAARKLSFVEALLETNAVDEDSIVAFLHSKLMIPRVGASVLEAVDRGALSRIPAELAQKHAVLPVSADETGNLTVAMVDPTDMRAVDAISAHTGAYLVRAVAPLRVVRAAIAKHYNLPAQAPVAAPVAKPEPAAPAAMPTPAAVIKPSAVIMPGAVLQPSAVVMTGTPMSPPRPAVVLPASALTSPFGQPQHDSQPSARPVPSASTAPAAKPSAPSIPQTPPTIGAPTVSAPTVSAPTVATPTVATPVPSTSPRQSVSMASVSANITPPPVYTPPPTPVFTPAATPATTPAPPPAFTPTPREEPAPSPVSTKTMPLFELGRRPEGSGATIPGNQRASDTLTGGSRSDVVDIPLDDLEDAPKPRDADESMTTSTWNPPNFGVAHEIVPLSPEAFQRLLPRFSAVRARDEVTDLLLDFLAEGFSRVIMFTHIKGEIRGRDARGEDLMVDAVRQIRIPATGPSLFSSVIDRHQPYFGPMRTDTAIDAAFFGALGGVEGVVLCLPVLLRDKVPLLVFASGSHNPVDPRSLQDLTNEVAAALERLIVTEKNRVR